MDDVVDSDDEPEPVEEELPDVPCDVLPDVPPGAVSAEVVATDVVAGSSVVVVVVVVVGVGQPGGIDGVVVGVVVGVLVVVSVGGVGHVGVVVVGVVELVGTVGVNVIVTPGRVVVVVDVVVGFGVPEDGGVVLPGGEALLLSDGVFPLPGWGPKSSSEPMMSGSTGTPLAYTSAQYSTVATYSLDWL